MEHKTERWIEKFRMEEKEVGGGLFLAFVNHIISYRVPIKKIIEYTSRNEKILETGFGTGFISIWLSHFGYDVTAIDKDENIVKYGKRNNELLKGKVKILHGDLFEEAGCYDLIFHIGVLEHFDEEDAIKILKKQINQGKYIIFCVPSINAKEAKDLYGDERLLSAKDWEKIILASGGKIIDKFGYCFNFMPLEVCHYFPLFNKIFYSRASNFGYVITNKNTKTTKRRTPLFWNSKPF